MRPSPAFFRTCADFSLAAGALCGVAVAFVGFDLLTEAKRADDFGVSPQAVILTAAGLFFIGFMVLRYCYYWMSPYVLQGTHFAIPRENVILRTVVLVFSIAGAVCALLDVSGFGKLLVVGMGAFFLDRLLTSGARHDSPAT